MRPKSEAKDGVNPGPLRGQRSHRNTYTTQIKESRIEMFSLVLFKSMNGTKVTELAALRLGRELD